MKNSHTPKPASASEKDAAYRYLKNMLDNIADPIFVKDQQHRWVDGNKAFWTLMGGEPEKFIGKSDYEFFPKEEADHFWEVDNKVFETGEPSINEEFFTDHEGKRRVLSTTKTVFLNEKNERVLVGVIRDITLQKEIEGLEEQRVKAEFYEQLEAKVQALQESNYELSRFAWVASHDLQEPLRTIVTYIELLMRRYGDQLDDQAKEYVETALQSSERLQELVEDLLVHARAEKIEDFVEVKLEEVLENVKDDLQMLIDESGASLQSDTLPNVMGEASLLGRVFQSLLSNAIKFRPPDAKPRITIHCEEKEDEWWFCMKDNGIGIPPEYHKRIFGFFERLHSKSEYPGTGIGLSTCKKIVELHGGKIWVESTPGYGSTFCFTLPREESEKS